MASLTLDASSLGDKFLELSQFNSPASTGEHAPTAMREATTTPGLNDELVSAYLAAAVDSVHSLLGLSPSDAPQWVKSDSGSAARLGPGLPTLMLMSDDDEGAVRAFRRHPHAGSFRIVGTSEEVSNDTTDVDGTKEKRRAVDRRSAHAPVPAGFVRVSVCSLIRLSIPSMVCDIVDLPLTKQNETAFNRLPLPSRIAATRQFVRDLTFLSRRADALVVTGSSNVGRLLMMLFDAENTNRSKAEGELQSRRREMRSLDTRFVGRPPSPSPTLEALPPAQCLTDDLNARCKSSADGSRLRATSEQYPPSRIPAQSWS